MLYLINALPPLLHFCSASFSLQLERRNKNKLTKHKQSTKEGKKDGIREGELGGGKAGEGLKKMNGRAEQAASIGKLYNECVSLASMMDESGIVFVTNAIFFESLCCFPVRGTSLCGVLNQLERCPNRVINI